MILDFRIKKWGGGELNPSAIKTLLNNCVNV